MHVAAPYSPGDERAPAFADGLTVGEDTGDCNVGA